jgi:hypothetical protein
MLVSFENGLREGLLERGKRPPLFCVSLLQQFPVQLEVPAHDLRVAGRDDGTDSVGIS